MNMTLQPIILSGGSGTRLWPLSREHYPKQLVTFGIVPTGPETGYGYIRSGEAVAGAAAPAHRIAAFVEKPDLATAQSYVDAGDYLWNSGLFVMKASVWLKAMAHYRPDIVAACRRAYEGGARDSDFYRVDKAAF